MIEHTLDKAHSILYVRPQSKLEQADFEQLGTVDPHIEQRGALAGLIIEALTGAPYRSWIRHAIVEPAGLQQTEPDVPVAADVPLAPLVTSTTAS